MKLENRGQEHVSLWSPGESFKVLVSVIGWSGAGTGLHTILVTTLYLILGEFLEVNPIFLYIDE
jgi:hypothetical protein